MKINAIMKTDNLYGGKEMKKLYNKSELAFSLMWIAAYCVLMSVGDNISAKVGINSIISLPVALIMSAVLLSFMRMNGLGEKYGLCKPKVSAKEMLYYIPLIIILLANVMFGVKVNLSVGETVLYMLTMLCVGFLEEIIFRGMLCLRLWLKTVLNRLSLFRVLLSA